MAVSWEALLAEEDVLGRILKDILKADQMEPGRSGPRPNLDYERGMRTWREMASRETQVKRTERDFTGLPFTEAFAKLIGPDSLTAIARKTSISRSRAHRLLNGHEEPTVDDLHAIAEAYGKHPAYWLEYRTELIVAALAARLAARPEMTVAIYNKLTRDL